MREASSYKVYSGAVIESGYDVDEVCDSFASLFRISPDQAREFVCKRKLIKKDLSESQANTYREKVNATGLVSVVLKDESCHLPAANDETTSPKPVVKPPFKKQGNPAAGKDEPVARQLICPKCSCMQPKSDQCTRCDLVFSKYRDPTAREKPEDPVADDPSDLATDVFDVAAVIAKHKSVVALIAGIAVVCVAFAFLKTKTSELSGPDGPGFVQRTEASDKILQLMVKAEFDDTFEDMAPEFEQLFGEQLAYQVEERGGSEQSVAFILSMVPKAFNTEGGNVSLANWFQLSLKDSEVDSLLGIYNSPILQKVSAITRKMEEDTAVHRSFLASYKNNPLDPQRRKALARLVTVMGLDSLMISLWEQAQTSIFKVAASTNPGYATAEQQYLTKVKIDDLQAMLPMLKPQARDEAVKAFAWHFESYSLSELKSLHSALDVLVMREFYDETRRGFENYFEDATDWLVEKTVARVAQGFNEVEVEVVE